MKTEVRIWKGWPIQVCCPSICLGRSWRRWINECCLQN